MRRARIALYIFAALTVSACTGGLGGGIAERDRTVVYGAQTGALYTERGELLQNGQTGRLYRKVGGAYVMDLQTGKLHYRYGKFVEEK